MRTWNLIIFAGTLFLGTSIIHAEQAQKRVPTGFTGVRGKKSYDVQYGGGLYGSGGGGSYDEDGGMSVVSGEENKRGPNGFMGMRGKKPFEEFGEIDGKRAPNGFMGMRGKKDLNFDEFEKRAPNGFMGMRGKKEVVDGDPAPRVYYDYFEKRVPAGFMGMRGKKESGMEDGRGLTFALQEPEEKRASNGFYGVRGKKPAPRTAGFFGMRGKKYPYEFRGKFVGVRGKKTSNEVDGGYDDIYGGGLRPDGLSLNQLMLLLTENEEYEKNLSGPGHD